MKIREGAGISKRSRRRIVKLSLLFVAAALAWHLSLNQTQAEAVFYQGFGATTPGGAGKPAVHVTNLNDSGPGSLRDAVSQGNRTVVFDVGGEIVLSNYVYVTGAFITIDGSTAPPSGITLKNRGLIIRGSQGAHDIIIQGIRVRNSPQDGIQIAYGAYNVVIDHVSIHGSGDGNLDITENSHDVTVSNSILAEPKSGKSMLIKYNASRVTLHHNIFVKGLTRNPNVSIDNAGTPATDTTLDMRNNLVWDWGSGWGTFVHNGAWANIVNNFYSAPNGDAPDGLIVDVATARTYVQGNLNPQFSGINTVGNEASPFPAPLVDSQDACTAASQALSGAGVRSLDALDQQYLTPISLTSCTSDSTRPSVSITAPANNSTVSGSVAVSANASDNVGVVGVQFFLDGVKLGAEDTTSPYSYTWDTTMTSNGLHTLSASARDAAGNTTTSSPVNVTVMNGIGQGSVSLELQITDWQNDASEYSTGAVRTSENSFNLGRNYLLAFRFPNIPIPTGTTITSAVLQMYAVASQSNSVNVRYVGENAGHSAPLVQAAGNLSNRLRTSASVNDIPGPWTVGAFNASPDLQDIIQEIVNHAGWTSGNSLTLFITDNGSPSNRKIGSVETVTSPTKAATLVVTYQAL